MTRTKNKQWLSLLLTTVMLLSCIMIPAHATESPVEAGTMTLTAPSDVEVILYSSFDYRNFTDAYKVAPTSVTTKDDITSYVFENLPVGNYNYYSSGEGYYTVDKNIWFSEAKAAAGYTVDANPGKLAGSFEQNPETSEGFNVVRLQTDEVWEKVFGKTWSDEADELLKSPYFLNRDRSSRDGLHQQTTNKEMVEYLLALDQDDDNMYIFWYDKEDVAPKHHLYDDYPGAPILVFTESDLSGADTLEEAAAVIAQNTDKVTIQYQAQVHSSEPAATEGAMVMARQLVGEFGDKVLKTVDVVMIPRFNSDGSYEWVRANVNTVESGVGIDMNRDFHYLSCPETRMVVSTFNTFYPEVVIDTHELQNQARGTDAADDLQMTGNGGGGLNPQPLADLAIEELKAALGNAKENYGIRGTAYGQYPYDVYTTIGAAYPATRGSIGHLIETKGIHAGMSMIERRVMSQWAASSGIIEFAAANNERILDTVAEARAEIIAKGATFEEDDVIVLRHSDVRDTEVYWEDYPVYDMASGEQTGTTDYTWIRRAGTRTSRPRPTAYVIPADIEGIDDILKVVEGHAINYYKLDEGSAVMLKQYVYGTKTSSTLTDESPVVFANGAYVFPMNQTASTLMGLMFEPDIYDNSSYMSDFIRMGYMEATSGEALPLYRYEHDLVDGKVTADGSIAIEVVPMQSDSVNTMKLGVSVSSGDGIGAAVIALGSDPALELIDVKGVDWTKGDKNLVINEDIAPNAVKSIELTFKVTGAVKGDAITARLVNACTMDEKELYATAVSAEGYIIGDANGNGEVGASDLVRLRSYIGLNGEGVEIFKGGDINGDSLYNTIDLTALNRYFATHDYN